jgi:hypothetical protein
MKLKFYVLTSRDFKALLRHNSSEYSNLSKEDTVVVINTLDYKYEQKVKNHCEEEGIEYYITKSDGTPAKGKNAVLDIFLESDNDYCVLIDGDDYLTKEGVKVYKEMANSNEPLDVICLKNQVGLHKGKKDKPFTVNFKKLIKDFNYDYLKTYGGHDHQTALRYALWRQKYFMLQRDYSEGSEIHCRVTWYSKKAASFKFDEELIVGEDTLQMLRLKHEALTNGLNMYTFNESPVSYIYNYTQNGILCQATNNLTNFEWLKPYLLKIKEMKLAGQLHKNTTLPRLQVNK